MSANKHIYKGDGDAQRRNAYGYLTLQTKHQTRATCQLNKTRISTHDSTTTTCEFPSSGFSPASHLLAQKVQFHGFHERSKRRKRCLFACCRQNCARGQSNTQNTITSYRPVSNTHPNANSARLRFGCRETSTCWRFRWWRILHESRSSANSHQNNVECNASVRFNYNDDDDVQMVQERVRACQTLERTLIKWRHIQKQTDTLSKAVGGLFCTKYNAPGM